MKVKLVLLGLTALAVGQSYSEPIRKANEFVQYGDPIRHKDCPVDEDPKTPTVLPFPGDCTKFYKCLHGNAHAIDCPSGLHWSVILNRCDWPEVAKCVPNTKVPPTASPNNPKPTNPPTEGNKGPSQNKLCPADEDPKNPTVLPYPGDCTKFYKCLHGDAHEISCPAGLHWSATLNRCDWPEVAKCQPTTTATEKSERKFIPSENVQKDALPKKGNSCMDSNVLRSHKTDCTKFFQCANGFEYEKTCPLGTHFNPKLMICDYPERARCKQSSLSEVNENMIPKNNQHKLNEPPIFHKDCHESSDPEDPVHLPYPNDCTKFYKCVGDMAHAMKCPSGLHWSTKSNKCDWPAIAECASTTTTDIPSTDTTPSTEIPTRYTTTSTENPTISTTIPGDPQPPAESNYCRNSKDNEFFPDPKDCSKYIQCANGIDYVKQCPSGLLWNQAIKYCDHPKNVNCKK